MSRISPHIQAILHALPERPGVYRYYNAEGTIIYVGKAKNLKRRVNSYFNREHDSYKTNVLVSNIADIRYLIVDSDQDAFLLENNLIKQYQPHYNILLKDGKTYPSIAITREPYPRIFKTRNIIKGAADYYGPYSFGNTVDYVLDLIHSLYPLRTCHPILSEDSIQAGKHKVCLKYHIHNCCGVCEGLVSHEEYMSYVEAARQIIRGDAHEISRQLVDEMGRLAAELRFEEAQAVKEKYLLLEKFRSKTVITNTSVRDVDVFGYDESGENVYVSMLHVHQGSITMGQTIEYKRGADDTSEEVLSLGIHELREQLGSSTHELLVPFMPDFTEQNLSYSTPTSGDRKRLLELAMENVRQYKLDRIKQSDKLNPGQRAMRVLKTLQDLLHLPEIPALIDSFDNSNIQGSDPVAGCVVFRNGKPSKADYRKFNIKTVVGPDDYASMREVVYRRYRRLIDENGELPNLIIADGGVGQMNAIREATQDQLGLDIPIVGLVKDDRHRTSTLLYGFPPAEIGIKPIDPLFHFLTQVQDEVHRYAISFHKAKRSHSQTTSELDSIDGIGEKTKTALLRHFKSIKRLREAKLDDIQQIVGKQRGSIIYDYFQSHLSS